MKRKLKRVLATLMALIMCICTYRTPIYAEGQTVANSNWDGVTTEKSYEADAYKVTFKLENYWDNGYNATIRIENKSDSVIEHWFLSFDLANTISNIWNAEVYKQEAGKYIIKNAGWNSNIPVGGMVEFGITVNEKFMGFPQEYNILGERLGVNNGEYVIDYVIDNAWEGGFQGTIKITNMTETKLENWKLSFNYDNEITSIWNGEIVTHEGNQYLIKNAGYNQSIDAHASVSFSFIVSGGSVDNDIINVDMECSGNSDGNTEEPGTGEGDGNTEEPGTGEGEGNTEEPGTGEGDGNTEEPGTGEGDGNTEEPGTGEGDDTTDEPEVIEIVIKVDELPYDKIAGDFYYVYDEFVGVNGNISNIQNVEKFYYEVYDLNEDVIETGDIALEENWKTGKIKLGMGACEIKIIAVSSLGEKHEESIFVFNSNYDNLSENVDMSDTDADNLPNCYEIYFGTDIDRADTDGDGLSDYDELLILGTDPTKSNAGEDGDGDGLTVEEEVLAGTNSLAVDTDGDGLSDGEEVKVYFTNPLSIDTDNDGLNDGDEIQLSFDPNNADTDGDGVPDVDQEVLQEVAVIIEEENNNEVSSVSVQLECAGLIENAVTISNVYGIDTYSSNVVGLVGVPIDIQSEVAFDEAVITFHYDQNSLGTTKEEDLCILWYDEENHKYVLLEDSVVDTVNHTVSYKTEHFSTYLLVDKEKWFATWREAISYDDEGNIVDENATYDIYLCIDTSVSEEEYEAEKEFARNIINQMQDGDRVAIALFLPEGEKYAGFHYYLADKAMGLAELDRFEELVYEGHQYLIEPTGTYKAECNVAIKIIKTMFEKDSSSKNKKVGFIINAGKNEDHASFITFNTDEEARRNLTTLGFPVHSVSVTAEINDRLETMLKDYDGESFKATTLDGIQRKTGFATNKKGLADYDKDGLPDIYETNGILLSNGQVIYTSPKEPDSDFDGASDYAELGGITKEDIVYSANEVYSCMVSNMISDPNIDDSDGDEILDGADPYPLKHFGTFIVNGNNSVKFKVTDEIKVPYNSAIENAKQVPIEEYERIYNERSIYASMSIWAQWDYINNIHARAICMLGMAGVANLGLSMADPFVDADIDINAGVQFLTYYLLGIGDYVEYDGTFPAVEDETGLQTYSLYIEQLLNVCESATGKGETFTFTAIDSAQFPINYAPYGFLNIGGLNYWLAVKGGAIGMTGKCTYSGTYYVLDLYYCVQDYYDFYYANPAGGKDSVGIVSNDEMAFLKYFGLAENYENCGVYHVNINWKAGDSLNQATQTPLAYTKLGK